MSKVVIKAVKVKGHCAAGIKEGDKIVVEGANLNLKETDNVCLYALASIFPTIYAARLGHDLAELGLPKGVVQCMDPGEPYTNGGTVFFKIENIKLKSNK